MHKPIAVRSSDEELAVKAQQGCRASFEELLLRFQVPVLHFLQRRGSPAEAEDLLQETFLRAYRNLHQYNSQWRFATWLFTIARRVGINHYRRSRPWADGSLSESAACPCVGPAEATSDRDSRRYLWEIARRHLSEEEVTAMWLHYVEDMPAREVGKVLGRSWVAVKTMMFRARRKLLPLLGELEPAGRRRRTKVDEVPSVCALAVEVPHV
jgi:RNA polymerase sigma-70 factor (ECF subfamily)